jgi:hypothetical protein
MCATTIMINLTIFSPLTVLILLCLYYHNNFYSYSLYLSSRDFIIKMDDICILGIKCS